MDQPASQPAGRVAQHTLLKKVHVWLFSSCWDSRSGMSWGRDKGELLLVFCACFCC